VAQRAIDPLQRGVAHRPHLGRHAGGRFEHPRTPDLTPVFMLGRHLGKGLCHRDFVLPIAAQQNAVGPLFHD